ncbi:MAG TPA: chemotaxis protein CheB [Thermoanaerobaculia bacterium]|nr:chemotaxis protein CheB [Thermoanaerobaculia bacterium]
MSEPRPGHDILVIGASAGGVQALCELVAGLPEDLPAAVLVVLHVSPHPSSALPAILTRCGRLPALHPEDCTPLQPGTVYVAPPDRHLTVERGQVCINRGPRENGHRPAVDVLFRTAARAYGNRVVGVVLTGNLDDGTAGLAAIKRLGGVAIVQDPEEADYPGMPASAVENVAVDHIASLAEIPRLLAELAHQEVEPWEEEEEPVAEHEPSEDRAHLGVDGGNPGEGYGPPSGLTCPDCGGALYDKQEETVIGFRCRVGHAYSPEALAAAQSEEIDAALWAAVRALEENAALAHRLAKRMAGAGKESLESRYSSRARGSERYAQTLRKILMQDEKELAGGGGNGDLAGGNSGSARAILTPRRSPRARNLE